MVSFSALAAAGSLAVAPAAAPPDFAAAVSACIAALPAAGGECDLRTFRGALKLTREVVLSRDNVTLLLPPGKIELAAAARFVVLGMGVQVEGAGKSATVLQTSGDSAFQIGNSSAIPRHWRIRRLAIAGTASAGAGIRMTNAREGRIDEVAVTDFRAPKGVGIAVGNDCWSVTLDDVNLVHDTVGVAFTGRNTNAWAFRTSNLSGNDTGALFDLGGNSAHGILFSDGTHFEDNKTAGIRVSSGEVYGLSVADPYIELGPGQRFLLFKGSKDAFVRLYSFSYSRGYLLASDSPAFELDSTARADDLAEAVFTGLTVTRRRGDAHPSGIVVRALGPRTRVSVEGGGVAIPPADSASIKSVVTGVEGSAVTVSP